MIIGAPREASLRVKRVAIPPAAAPSSSEPASVPSICAAVRSRSPRVADATGSIAKHATAQAKEAIHAADLSRAIALGETLYETNRFESSSRSIVAPFLSQKRNPLTTRGRLGKGDAKAAGGRAAR